jgi:benzoate membrane transport protein
MPIDFVECARTLEGTPPGVHVRGRIGDMHGFVAPGDACEDVDLAADFRADEAGGQADAPLMVADEGHLREEPTGVRSPVGADEGALVGASPRQAHDVDAAAHRPRARASGQADVSGQDDACDAVFRDGGGGQRAGRVDEDAARFDVDACAVAADIEDAVGLACGFIAGPGGPRVDADARERFLLVNVLGRQVGDARARVDGRGGDGIDGISQALLAWCRVHEGGSDARVEQASPRGVPVKVQQGRVGEDAHDQVGVRGLGEFVDNGGVGVGQA